MLLISIGAPGRFSEWCEAVIARLAFEGAGVRIIAADCLTEIGRALVEHSNASAVIASRQPDPEFQRTLIAAGSRFVLVLDDPRKVIADRVVRQGMSLIEATRQIANIFAVVDPLTSAPSRLQLGPAATRSPAQTAAALVRDLGLTADAHRIVEIVDELRAIGCTPETPVFEPWWESLSTDDRSLIDGATGFYSQNPGQAAAREFVWGPELFIKGDEIGVPVNGDIDATGRSRILVYGPYIRVPTGSWIAEVRISVSSGLVGSLLTVEACTGFDQDQGINLAQVELRPSTSGTFTIRFDFDISDASPGRCEIRLYVKNPIFDGTVSWSGVVLTPRIRFQIDEPHLSSRVEEPFRATLLQS